MNFSEKIKDHLNETAGLGTCLIVFSISLYWLNSAEFYYRQNFWLVLGCFFVYALCFYSITSIHSIQNNKTRVNAVLCLQLLSAYIAMLLLPLTFLSILTIIWISAFSHFYRAKTTLLVLCVVMVSWFGLYDYFWHEESIVFQALLYFTFHVFALLMGYQTQKAEQAKKDVEQLNGELLATNQLLAQVTRQSERTRIARDLHDLLGHHLTALIINLQVAGHLTEGEAKTKVDNCHQLAKLLLSDVREAVSTLRDSQLCGFKEMILVITDNVPKLTFEVTIDTNIMLDDIGLLKELLSCIQESITNSLKHSDADRFFINSEYDDNNFKLTMKDNGSANSAINLGHGLMGIKERVGLFNGEVSFDNQCGFQTVINIPLSSLTTNDKSGKV